GSLPSRKFSQSSHGSPATGCTAARSPAWRPSRSAGTALICAALVSSCAFISASVACDLGSPSALLGAMSAAEAAMCAAIAPATLAAAPSIGEAPVAVGTGLGLAASASDDATDWAVSVIDVSSTLMRLFVAATFLLPSCRPQPGLGHDLPCGISDFGVLRIVATPQRQQFGQPRQIVISPRIR